MGFIGNENAGDNNIPAFASVSRTIAEYHVSRLGDFAGLSQI